MLKKKMEPNCKLAKTKSISKFNHFSNFSSLNFDFFLFSTVLSIIYNFQNSIILLFDHSFMTFLTLFNLFLSNYKKFKF